MIEHEPCKSRGNCHHARGGRIGGPITNAKPEAQEWRTRGGQSRSPKKLAQLKQIASLGGRIQGPIQGRKNVGSGHTARALEKARDVLNANPEILRKAARNQPREVRVTNGRIAGYKFGPINVRKLQDPDRVGHLYVYDCTDGTLKIGFTSEESNSARSGIRRKYPNGRNLLIMPNIAQADEWKIHDTLHKRFPESTIPKERYQLPFKVVKAIVEELLGDSDLVDAVT